MFAMKEIAIMLAPLPLTFLFPRLLRWYSPQTFKEEDKVPSIIRIRTKYDYITTIILSFAFLFYFYSAISPPQNIFLSLAPSSSKSMLSRVMPVLRKPLHIRTPTDQLAKKWSTQTKKDLSQDSLLLLSRLQNLDARLAYIAYGEKPLLYCEWCRSPSSGNYNLDYFFYNLPFLALSYLILLVILGSATFGDWNYWRIIMVIGAGAGFTGEITWRWWLTTIGASTPNMLFTKLHTYRNLYFAFMSISTYYLPACPSLQPVTVTSVLNPLLGQLALQCDTVLSRMRASSLQRTAILQPKANRERAVKFWNDSESLHQGFMATKGFETVKKRLEVEEAAIQQKKTFKSWLDSVMVFSPPTPVIQEVQKG